ncbi:MULTISPECIES: cobalt-precorrin-6A reductase [unclassified Streptomyces]|uniref:cobalt-precorrin-6A reductase n=1 Tax=unclassified Streptomyces TaxID=2593676 RepID=UPI001F004D61|nr:MULTISPECIES: cobalt-precorrin-6A reductase [unclassified Streptomyces]
MTHVLILGGTTEARELAEVLDGRVRVTSSLAGRVAAPRLPVGEVRVGGFGGVEGMVEWVRGHGVDAVVDATHPFAERISFNAARAAGVARVPLLALRRPGWVAGEGDDWREVGSSGEAAEVVGRFRRVFLTTGRQELAAFAHVGGVHFLVRAVDAPEPPFPDDMDVLLQRGPFTLEGERELIARHRIDALVTKDSGGAATAPKLVAAREAGIPVVVVRRPPVPEGVEAAATVVEAAAWVQRVSG